MLTVTEQLRRRGELDEVGGEFVITELTGRVASAANIEFHARIIAQKGVFTVHKNPTKPLDQTKINGDFCCVDQLIIPKAAIREFVKDLDWFGINRSFIYPGLDGLAYYLDFKAKGGID